MERSSLSHLMYLTSHNSNKREDGRCHICLNKAKLTREHVPPRSAFNGENRLWHHLNYEKSHDRLSKKQFQSGFWVNTLCAQCNNVLCQPYSHEYLKFVRAVAGNSHVLADKSGKRFLLTVRGDTLMIAKQIAAMILAFEPVSYAAHYGQLREFVLNSALTIDPMFRILAFLVPRHNSAGTMTRIHGRVDTFSPGYKYIGGEISAYPFGFLYAFEIGPGYRPKEFADLTHWFWRTDVHDRKNQVVDFPVKLTGVDAIQCGIGYPRNGPQLDVV